MVGSFVCVCVCKAHCSSHFYGIRIDSLHEGNPVFLGFTTCSVLGTLNVFLISAYTVYVRFSARLLTLCRSNDGLADGPKLVYMITLLPCLSQCAQSGRRTSFGRRVLFTESHIVLVIFSLLIVLFINFILNIKKACCIQLN
jgi:hypothetical protein